MTRKARKSTKRTAAPAEEILAEGSGPVASAEPVAEPPADAAELAAAVDDIERRRHAPVVGDPGEAAAAADELAVEEPAAVVADELAAAEPAAADEPVAVDPDGAVVESDEESDLATDLAAALPTSAASMDATQLRYLVEALVFASDKPITVSRLRQLTRVSDTRRLEQALTELAADFADRGLVLQQVSGGYQFRTRTQFSSWVQQLIAGRPVRLSRAQLETLAIIAYRQPITRPEIDDIRGVDSSATLKLLIDRQLIRILGKKEEVGRPMLYGTTKEFLDFFSLGDLRELPTLREYSELTDESRRVMSDRLGVELDPDARDPDDGDDGSGSGGGGDDSGDSGDSGGGMGSGDPGGSIDHSSPGLGAAEADVAGEGSDQASEAAIDEPVADGVAELASEAAIDESVADGVAELASEAANDESVADGVAELASEVAIDEPAIEVASELASEAAIDEPAIEVANELASEAAPEQIVEAPSGPLISAPPFTVEAEAAPAVEDAPVFGAMSSGDALIASPPFEDEPVAASEEWAEGSGPIGDGASEEMAAAGVSPIEPMLSEPEDDAAQPRPPTE